MTDRADHLELLEANVYHNGLEDRVSVALLDWVDEGTFALLDDALDLVLATDCAYHESLHEPLINVLKRACAHDKTTCVLGVTKSDTGLEFFDALHAAGLDYHLIEPPSDEYSALLSIKKTRAFKQPRDAKQPPWSSP